MKMKLVDEKGNEISCKPIHCQRYVHHEWREMRPFGNGHQSALPTRSSRAQSHRGFVPAPIKTAQSIMPLNITYRKENNSPILISFKADLRDVIIDGRDFLYTLFQLGDPQRARPIAERIYGSAIVKYLDRAWSTDSQDQRIVMCDLATQDDAVIKADAKNRIVIAGRHYTRFRTAFMVKLPVPANRIISVGQLDPGETAPQAEITLDMIRAG